ACSVGAGCHSRRAAKGATLRQVRPSSAQRLDAIPRFGENQNPAAVDSRAGLWCHARSLERERFQAAASCVRARIAEEVVDVIPTARARLKWSVARMMSGIAVLAVGLAVLLALRPAPLVGDGLIGILCFVIAAVLTAATDRAFFARTHRAFWLGFAATA